MHLILLQKNRHNAKMLVAVFLILSDSSAAIFARLLHIPFQTPALFPASVATLAMLAVLSLRESMRYYDIVS